MKIKGLKPIPKTNSPQKSFFLLAKPLETTIPNPPKEEFSFLNKNKEPEKPIVNENVSKKVQIIPKTESFQQPLVEKKEGKQSDEPSATSVKKSEPIQSKMIESPKPTFETNISNFAEKNTNSKTMNSEKTNENHSETKKEEEQNKHEEPKSFSEKALKVKVIEEKEISNNENKPKLFGFKTPENPLTFSASSNNTYSSGNLFLQNKPNSVVTQTPSISIFQQPTSSLFGAPNPTIFQQNGNLFGNTTVPPGGLFNTLLQQQPNGNTTLPFLNNIKKGIFFNIN